ncbi:MULTISPECIES: MotA/TolQ/ExbB proton channel family protein [unclassified Novosphingobium]|uniref:MotA/TolQ/ExbB proton channel family protein n=1 Tax=unclassified Novosphingobium TaxID=2644732 RepID=UPI000D31DF44|nr:MULTISPECIES: MotA/TolQ/ExbB proton channel family protein [unclassified Novosphingobium]PTR09354.1 chemotaxis protein MotA [Novosphingobium sp. GV055]PUB02205.1 chemotaxis protein MotA [Novosphingobium sp. GV061]PUB18386.1 chemotaxis protein MotA [Novosphingobium sp. GV079]PUB40638.1 chemotaxis protein MotA [Novosphingobium sp. GV027]
MDLTHLLDAQSAVIVVGGTLVGTVLRCGWHDSLVAVRAVAGLLRPGFNAAAMRSELAHEVALIRRDGVIRANPRRLADREFDSATTALVRTRSLDGLVEQHETWRRARLRRATTAARTLAQAADLSPVFGLAGTLVALSQLKVESLAHGNFIGAIAMSVLTTLYGLLLAHIVMGPLGRAVERASQAEEEARADVMTWLTQQVGPACPDRQRATPLSPHGVTLPRRAANADGMAADTGLRPLDPRETA